MKLLITLLLSSCTSTFIFTMHDEMATLALVEAQLAYEKSKKELTLKKTDGPHSDDTDHQRIIYAFQKKDKRAIEGFIEECMDLNQEILYQNPGDKNGDNLKFTTLLELAWQHELPEIIIQLRRRGVSIETEDIFGNLPLQQAVISSKNDPETLFALMTKKTINHQNKKGQTALHQILASDRIRAKVVNLLLENGACRDIADQDGNTPVHIAAHHDATGRHLKCLLALINSKKEKYTLVNAQNNAGKTSLHLAIESFLNPAKTPNKSALKFLLDFNSQGNLAIKDIENRSPVDLVWEASDKSRGDSLRQYLIEYRLSLEQFLEKYGSILEEENSEDEGQAELKKTQPTNVKSQSMFEQLWNFMAD